MADETTTIEQAHQDAPAESPEGKNQEDGSSEAAASEHRVENIGPGRKRIIMTISEGAIAEKLKTAFGELHRDATLPGFRKGRAPRRLLEKKFGGSLRNTIKEQLIADAYSKAVEQENIAVLGEPDAKNIANAQLPESGPMEVSIEVDVTPEFTLPSLKELSVMRPRLELNDARMEAALQNVRTQFAEIKPREGASEKGDIIELHIEATRSPDGAKPGARLRGVAGQTTTVGAVVYPELAEKLIGVSVGDVFAVDGAPAAEGPDAPAAPAHLECKIISVSQRVLPEINDDFVQPLGFNNVDDLKENLSRELQSRLLEEQSHLMEQQVYRYLLANTQMELPEKAVEMHTRQLVQRRAMEMMERGIPMEEISAQIQQMGVQAVQQSALDLKLFFILSKFAEDNDVEINDGMLNSAVDRIAAMNGRRPEKMRQDMEKSGQLAQLALRLRDQLTVRVLLEDITVTDVDEGEFMAKSQAESQVVEGAGPNIHGVAQVSQPAQPAAEENKPHEAAPAGDQEHASEGHNAGESHAT